MALNVNALARTTDWPLTPFEQLGHLKSDEGDALKAPSSQQAQSQLNAVLKDGREYSSQRHVLCDRDKAKKNDPKIWLKLLDSYY